MSEDEIEAEAQSLVENIPPSEKKRLKERADAEMVRQLSAQTPEKQLRGLEAVNQAEIIDVTPRKHGIVERAMGAKSYLSTQKLKWEASKYGVTPSEFDKAEAEGRLGEVRRAIDSGRERELYQEKQRKLSERYEAQTKNIESVTEKRDYEREVTPDGWNRAVKFGSKNFGREPIYIAEKGQHHSLRDRYTPQPAVGVQSSLQRSRERMAYIQQTVLSRPSVSYSHSAISPSRGGFTVNPPGAAPSAVYRLQPHIVLGAEAAPRITTAGKPNHGNILSRLSASPSIRGGGAGGQNIIARLSPRWPKK